jgi:hypothetical protein
MSFPDSLTKPQATKSRSDDIINLNQPLFFVLYALFFGAAQQRLTHKKWATEPATHLNVTDY